MYSVTSISNNTEQLILYTTYDDFRHSVDTLLNEVLERLGK
ncbi:hypothetical protein HMPREF1870_00543 [Bacteroidales bacterium KA00344]|nr:hypothetical protein HMPREF1870_00543 [Bacteroidales bacterium KA00344]